MNSTNNKLARRHRILESMETPVLVAWAKRSLSRAEQTFQAEAARVNPPRDEQGKISGKGASPLWCAQRALGLAAGSLAALLADRGTPVTVRTDPADFGADSFTFSREQKAGDVIFHAARAMAQVVHEKGRPFDDTRHSIEDEMYADLTRNIGAEA